MTAVEIAYFNLLKIMIVIFFFIVVIAYLFPKTKSYRYRKLLNDLYVSGRIRQLAKEKNIDLVEEFNLFKLFIKNQKINMESLDATIESELQEGVANDFKTEDFTKESSKK